MKTTFEPSSFRDPSGFVYYEGNKVFRQINRIFKENFEFFQSCGLYKDLLEKELILPFKKVSKIPIERDAYAVIETIKIPFVSYPYEWSFAQLQDSALLTLTLQKMALEKGMILKDATSYNVQFYNGKPIFIDHLSFEKYEEGSPWIAYKQFCQHFLAPLSLMAKKDVRLNQLLKIYIDGIPLDLAGRLLPKSTWLNLGLATHIHIHGKSQQRFSKNQTAHQKRKMVLSLTSLLGIIDSLETAVRNLKLESKKTQWGDYYTFTNYSEEAFSHKKKIVKSLLEKLKPTVVWDLGANTGEFSRISSDSGINTISFDMDPVAVAKNYLSIKKNKEIRILPLLMDLTNPTSGAGWENTERKSLIARGPVDCVLALALVHHLALSNNVPLLRIAKFIAGIAKSAIVEFVPKSDSQVKKLLATREDIFTDYDMIGFENAFSKYFKIEGREKIKDSDRIIYCIIKK